MSGGGLDGSAGRAQGLRGEFRGCFVGARLILALVAATLLPCSSRIFPAVALDEQTWALRAIGWDGEETVLARLGGRSAAFAAALRKAREGLSRRGGGGRCAVSADP